jgi:hypothetical protein
MTESTHSVREPIKFILENSKNFYISVTDRVKMGYFQSTTSRFAKKTYPQMFYRYNWIVQTFELLTFLNTYEKGFYINVCFLYRTELDNWVAVDKISAQP